MYQKLKNIMLIRNQNDQIKQCVKSTGSKLKKKYNSPITNMKFLIENYEFFSSMNYNSNGRSSCVFKQTMLKHDNQCHFLSHITWLFSFFKQIQKHQ